MSIKGYPTTVGEMIKDLERYPPHWPVKVHVGEHYNFWDPQAVWCEDWGCGDYHGCFVEKGKDDPAHEAFTINVQMPKTAVLTLDVSEDDDEDEDEDEDEDV